MKIEIKLTEQEERALQLICVDPAGVQEKDLQTQLGVDRNGMLELLISLRGKGFKFNVQPKVMLSKDYAHYNSLIKR